MDKIPEISLKTLQDVRAAFFGNRYAYRKWIFRGQEDASWGVQSSLDRQFDHIKNNLGKISAQWQNHETKMLSSMKSSAHLFNAKIGKDDSDFEWLALMQHHGCPTRLIDFSFSPLVALFFAVASGIGDLSVYAIEVGKIKSGIRQVYKFTDLNSLHATKDDFLRVYSPGVKSERQLIQQGVFVYRTTLFSGEIDYMPTVAEGAGVKYVISASLRGKIILLLNRANVSHLTLFPGFDGFCKSLSLQPLINVATL